MAIDLEPKPVDQFEGPCPDLGCEGLIIHARDCPRINDPILVPKSQ